MAFCGDLTSRSFDGTKGEILVTSKTQAEKEFITALPGAKVKDVSETEKEGIGKSLSALPVSFTANQGQYGDKILFRCDTSGASFYFAPGEVSYLFTRSNGERIEEWRSARPGKPDKLQRAPCKRESLLIKVRFVGGNTDAEVIGEDKLPHKSNFFVGNDPSKWRTEVDNYSSVRYRGLYPGIDLKYYGNGHSLKYDFILKPGAEPSQIEIEYEGVNSLSVNDKGELVVSTQFGDIVEKWPYAYQRINGQKREIVCRYLLLDKDKFGFVLDKDYDRTQSVVIDPELSYSTYLGGSDCQDWAFEIAVDGAGCAYVTGLTYSSDFPLKNPFQGSLNGPCDVFITKVSSSGSALIYSTYLGGSFLDGAHSIAVDRQGCAYVTGGTIGWDFPLKNPFQRNYAGGWGDGFIAKLSSSGSALIYSTYLGGSEDDIGYGVAVDSAGCAYVTGRTHSTDFPLKNPFQGSLKGPQDVFITKLSSSGRALIYSTYLGGSGGETQDYCGNVIAVDGAGCAYVTGVTHSSDFPLKNAFRGSLAGSNDAFITKLSSSGSSLSYSTYLGGSGNEDWSYGIAVDGAGCAYVTGYTFSSDFPLKNPFQGSLNGLYDVFITKLSSSGSALIYSTYLGGNSGDYGWGIAVDSAGCAYVTGGTGSSDFPLKNPFQGSLNGGCDSFVTKVTAQGNPNPDIHAFLEASPNRVAADGSSTSLITLTLLNGSGNPISGKEIEFSTTLGTFSNINPITNSNGQASCELSSSTIGIAKVTCYNVTDEKGISAVATVEFFDSSLPVIISIDMDTVGKFFKLEDIPVDNTITVQVDWRENDPGKIKFILNDKEFIKPWAEGGVSYTFDMSSVLEYLPEGSENILRIVAVTADESKNSEDYIEEFKGCLLPEWATSDTITLGPFEIEIDPGSRDVILRANYKIPPVEENFEATVPDEENGGVPTVDGENGMNLNPVELFLEINLNRGSACFHGSGGVGFESGNDVSFSVDTQAEGNLLLSPVKLQELAFKIQFEGRIDFPPVYPIPALPFIYFTGAVEPAIDSAFYYEEGPPEIECIPDTGLTWQSCTCMLAVGVEGVCGVGLRELVSVEGFIKGTPAITFQFPGDPDHYYGNEHIRQVSFTIEAGGRIYLGNIIIQEFSEEWFFIRPEDKGTLGGRRSGSVRKRGWSLEDRSYLNHPLGYARFTPSGGTRSDGTLSNPRQGSTETILLTNAYHLANPRLAASTGSAMILYIHDDGAKRQEGALEIHSVHWDGVEWNEPEAVTDDQTLDLQPALIYDERGNVVAVWTKAPDYTGGGPEELVQGLEIAYAFYGSATGQWSAPQILTDNAYPDLLPTLFRDSGGTITLAWLSAPDGNFPYDPDNPMDLNTSIRLATWDGSSFTNIETALSGIGSGTQPEYAESDSGVEVLVWEEDTDGNNFTKDDRDIYGSFRNGGAWTAPTALTTDSQPDCTPRLVPHDICL